MRLIPSHKRVPLGGLTYHYAHYILSYAERWMGDRSIQLRVREHPCLLVLSSALTFVEQSSLSFYFPYLALGGNSNDLC